MKRASDKWHWRALAACSPCAILLLANLLSGSLNYNRWDNHECLTGWVYNAHSRWLAGAFPQVNSHQFMGEPIIGSMQAASLYFPYTVCVAVIRVLHLPPTYLPWLSVILHSSVASLGWFVLLTRLGVRPVIALATAMGAPLAGFWTAMGSVWLLLAPLSAWLPWQVYAVVRVLTSRESGSWLWALAFLLAATMYAGFAQFGIYAGLLVLMFGLGYAFVVSRSARLPALGLGIAASILIAAPMLVPGYSYISQCSRADALSKDTFLERSVEVSDLPSVLLPVYPLPETFMPGKSVYLYTGSWAVPLLALAALSIWLKKGSVDSELRRTFLVAVAVAGVLGLLALGESGVLLPLTYGVPLWSSFRWPFKFVPFFATALTLAVGTGWEIAWQAVPGSWGRRVAALVGVFALVLLAWNLFDEDSREAFVRAMASWAGPATFITGLAAMFLLASPIRGRWIIAIIGLHWLAFVVYCHENPELRPYGEVLVGPAELGVQQGYRVVPLTVPDLNSAPSWEYGLFNAASINGYDSLTGCETIGLVPRWYERVLPCETSGTGVFLGPKEQLVGSNLLRSFNVRYYIVGKQDVRSLSVLERLPGLRRHRELKETLVFEDPAALPRAFFARAIRAGQAKQVPKLISELTTADTAYVETGEFSEGSLARGEILRSRLSDEHIELELRAPQGGFVVVSQLWTAGWRAWVDGREAHIPLVNSAIMGIRVPAGARRIMLKYSTPGLASSIALAAAGIALLALSTVVQRRF